jgi:hypothetical protein
VRSDPGDSVGSGIKKDPDEQDLVRKISYVVTERPTYPYLSPLAQNKGQKGFVSSPRTAHEEARSLSPRLSGFCGQSGRNSAHPGGTGKKMELREAAGYPGELEPKIRGPRALASRLRTGSSCRWKTVA